jgi:hypothetical protein
MFTPYTDKIIWDHQSGFWHNGSAYQIFCICQILEEKMKYNGTANQLFMGFEKAYKWVRRELLYNILTEYETS